MTVVFISSKHIAKSLWVKCFVLYPNKRKKINLIEIVITIVWPIELFFFLIKLVLSIEIVWMQESNHIKRTLASCDFNRIVLHIFRVPSRKLNGGWESIKMILYSIVLVLFCGAFHISNAADSLTFENWFSFGMNALSDIFSDTYIEKPCGDR